MFIIINILTFSLLLILNFLYRSSHKKEIHNLCYSIFVTSFVMLLVYFVFYNFSSILYFYIYLILLLVSFLQLQYNECKVLDNVDYLSVISDILFTIIIAFSVQALIITIITKLFLISKVLLVLFFVLSVSAISFIQVKRFPDKLSNSITYILLIIGSLFFTGYVYIDRYQVFNTYDDSRITTVLVQIKENKLVTNFDTRTVSSEVYLYEDLLYIIDNEHGIITSTSMLDIEKRDAKNLTSIIVYQDSLDISLDVPLSLSTFGGELFLYHDSGVYILDEEFVDITPTDVDLSALNFVKSALYVEDDTLYLENNYTVYEYHTSTKSFIPSSQLPKCLLDGYLTSVDLAYYHMMYSDGRLIDVTDYLGQTIEHESIHFDSSTTFYNFHSLYRHLKQFSDLYYADNVFTVGDFTIDNDEPGFVSLITHDSKTYHLPSKYSKNILFAYGKSLYYYVSDGVTVYKMEFIEDVINPNHFNMFKPTIYIVILLGLNPIYVRKKDTFDI